MSNIHSEEKSLGDILSAKNTLRVPTYQRNFSWTKAEIKDLWDDIQTVLFRPQDSHFLGSMVFIDRDGNVLDVVDGQQRLATVSLLLAAIRGGYQSRKDEVRAQMIENDYLCTRDFKTLEPAPKLTLNEMDNDLYRKIIDGKTTNKDLSVLSRNKAVMESQRLIARAYLDFFDYVKAGSSEFTNVDYLFSLLTAITDRVSCIQVITDNEDAAYVLFETLNDRGIDLTLSDMLKNFLFSKGGQRLDEVRSLWTQIVALIGQEHMKTFIRHEWMSKYGQTREKDLYKKIKNQIHSNPEAFDYVTKLKASARVYDAIRNPDDDLWSPYGVRCRQLLEELLVLGPIQCYPLILSTYLKTPTALEEVLRWIVSLTVRYSIICAKGTGNLEVAYAKAGSTMYDKPNDLKQVKEPLLNIFPTDEEFEISFKDKTLTTPRIITYLLAKLEVATAGGESLVPNPGSLTVEHILPKNPGSEWPSKMRKDEYLKEHLNLIGNLTILTEPMNREAAGRGFAFKKSVYKGSDFTITKDLCSLSDWQEKEILDRQAGLAKLATTTWKL